MSTLTRRVLILDDEDDFREQLSLCFRGSTAFQFNVNAAASLEECIQKDINGDNCDIVVIDLSLAGVGAADIGGLFLLISDHLWKTEYRIVYTAHATLENAVRAMQLGATDFVSKNEKSIKEFVEHVEDTIVRRQRQAQDKEIIRQYLLENLEVFRRDRPGMILAIAVNRQTDKPEVVAEGSSKLRVLMDYDQKRQGASGRFPLDPHLHLVPARPSDSGDV